MTTLNRVEDQVQLSHFESRMYRPYDLNFN